MGLPFVLGMGLGVGIGIFVATNWEEIGLHIRAIRAYVEDERRKRGLQHLQEHEMAYPEQKQSFPLRQITLGEGEGSDTEREDGSTAVATSRINDIDGSLRNRQTEEPTSREFFTMPPTDSSVSESQFTVYTGPSSASASSTSLAASSAVNAALSTDDWTDAAHSEA